jgi:hypothetical protein
MHFVAFQAGFDLFQACTVSSGALNFALDLQAIVVLDNQHMHVTMHCSVQL